ncbi:MAG: type VI secretion system protein TssA [Longimicrobiales bacterium]
MELRDDLLEPIQGDNPAGIDLRYEPVYDEVKLARTEEDDIPQGEWARERKTADFRRVIELTQSALATQTKDLQLAAWLAEALLREQGFQGFLKGLELIRELLARFWDHLYPELEDGDVEFRATPLEWLSQYLDYAVKSVPLNQSGHSFLDYREAQAVGYESVDQDKQAKEARQAAVDEGKLTPEAFDQAFAETPKSWYKEMVASIGGCLGAIDALDKDGDARFGSVAPSYSSLKRSIGSVQRVAKKLLDKKLETDPDPLEPEPSVTPTPESGEPAVNEPAATAPSAAPGSRADAAKRIQDAARFMRGQNPRDPAPYSLLRGFRWAELRGGGDPPNPRLLEAPPTETRTRLKSLLLDESWSALLEAAEEVMASAFGRGWLDLQRYVMTALDGLGDDYSSVRRIVRGALAELLREIPSLTELTLMDDSPTANRQTLRWLEAEGIASGADAAEGDSDKPIAPAGGGPRDLIRRARDRTRSGHPEKAVELLLHAAEQAPSMRESFLHRSEATTIMIDHGMDAIARPILDDMVTLIESHTLESWESGETVARPLGLLFRLKQAAGEGGGDELYHRICRLDPIQAIRFQANTSAEEPPTVEGTGNGSEEAPAGPQ